MPLRFRTLSWLAIVGAVLAPLPATAQAGPYTAFANRAVADVVVPAFATLSADASALATGLETFCATPTAGGLALVEEDFRAVALTWARIVPMQLEPLRAGARRERFFFWPDPRGITLRQIQPVIAERDPTATDPATLQEKSAALQGLGALEFLLYGTGAETLLIPGDDGAFRCAYAEAIGANLATIAGDLVDDVAPGAPFVQIVATPGPENPLYRADNEATVDLIMSAVTAVELADDQIVTLALGATVEEARPRLAPLWRSDLTLPFLSALVASTATLLDGADVMPLLAADQTWLPEQVRREVLAVGAAIAAIPAGLTFEAAITDPVGRRQLTLAGMIVDNIKQMLGINLPPALGIDLGFNALDGD